MSNSSTLLSCRTKPEDVAGKIDIVPIKTAEISRREKKRNNRGGNIYVPITKL